MARSTGHLHADAAAVATIVASTTADASGCGRGPESDVRMFGDVAPEVRLRMELLARASASPDTALPHVVALLVGGDEPKQAAIVQAITDHDALREQWHRTWEALRR